MVSAGPRSVLVDLVHLVVVKLSTDTNRDNTQSDVRAAAQSSDQLFESAALLCKSSSRSLPFWHVPWPYVYSRSPDASNSLSNKLPPPVLLFRTLTSGEKTELSSDSVSPNRLGNIVWPWAPFDIVIALGQLEGVGECVRGVACIGRLRRMHASPFLVMMPKITDAFLLAVGGNFWVRAQGTGLTR